MGGTGNEINRFTLTPKVHDTDVGISGKYAYMETKSSNIVTMVDIATNTIFRELNFTDIVGPHAVNGTDTLVIGNVNQWFGFEMVSVATGNVVARVHAEGVADPPAQSPPALENHAIAWKPDETEVFLGSKFDPNLFIFDMTVMPPVQKRRITVGAGYTNIHWITVSIDGNYVYPSPDQNSGIPVQIYDSRTWQVIGTMGYSEKLMEVDFQDGQVVAVGNQYGIGRVAAPPTAPPPAPTGLTATGGNAQVVLGWNPVAGASSYTVKWSTVPGGGYTSITGITGAGHTHTGLSNGTTYYYVVSASNAVGESPNSGEVQATPSVPPPVVWASDAIPSTLTPAGSFSQTGSTFTVSASGTDIYGTADQFRFVHQALTGDGSITARVATLCGGTPGSCPNVWTKAGVMMRDGTGDRRPQRGGHPVPDGDQQVPPVGALRDWRQHQHHRGHPQQPGAGLPAGDPRGQQLQHLLLDQRDDLHPDGGHPDHRHAGHHPHRPGGDQPHPGDAGHGDLRQRRHHHADAADATAGAGQRAVHLRHRSVPAQLERRHRRHQLHGQALHHGGRPLRRPPVGRHRHQLHRHHGQRRHDLLLRGLGGERRRREPQQQPGRLHAHAAAPAAGPRQPGGHRREQQRGPDLVGLRRRHQLHRQARHHRRRPLHAAHPQPHRHQLHRQHGGQRHRVLLRGDRQQRRRREREQLQRGPGHPVAARAHRPGGHRGQRPGEPHLERGHQRHRLPGEARSVTGGPYTALSPAPTSPSFTDTTVSNGTTYYYVVSATSPEHEGPSSAQVSATPTVSMAPAPPSNLGATTTGGNTANLTWTDNSSNETGFRVERKVGAGAYATLATKAAGVTTHADPNLTANTLHLPGDRHGHAGLGPLQRGGGDHRQPGGRRLRAQRDQRHHQLRHRGDGRREEHHRRQHPAQRLPALLAGGGGAPP